LAASRSYVPSTGDQSGFHGSILPLIVV